MLGMIKNSLFGSVETWPWQVLSKGDKQDISYEERACEGGKFATVEMTDKPVDEALREAMPKVMKYVGGSNDKGIGMGMTVPISFAVFPSDGGSLQKKLKVWFRIPNEFQSNPPVPSDDSIKIEERESITVYSFRPRDIWKFQCWILNPLTPGQRLNWRPHRTTQIINQLHHSGSWLCLLNKAAPCPCWDVLAP
uniref:Heme-binding protein 1 n=1 Tax=Sus scrofa TaxID=9823 RepID=A0A8D1Q1M5_PIG